jgi:hypothetical protein
MSPTPKRKKKKKKRKEKGPRKNQLIAQKVYMDFLSPNPS